MWWFGHLSSRLTEAGLLGALTNRTCLATSQLSKWRKETFLGQSNLSIVADLGYGVLDDAMVEAAAYVIERSRNLISLIGIRLLDAKKKDEELIQCLSNWENGIEEDRCLIGLLDQYRKLPLNVIAYWAAPSLLNVFSQEKTIKTKGKGANDGGHTGDDFRFVRAVWEILPESIGRGNKYVFFAKGGEYSPFWDDIHLVEYWKDNGKEIRELSGARIYHEDIHFKPGITYPLRTTSDFSPRILPKDTMFSTGGHGIHFKNKDDHYSFLAYSYTRASKVFVEILFGGGDASVSGSAARNYTGGTISLLPFPKVSSTRVESLRNQVIKITNSFFKLSLSDETNRYYSGLPYIDPSLGLMDSIKNYQGTKYEAFKTIFRISELFEKESFEIFSLLKKEVDSILTTIYGTHPCNYKHSEDIGDLSDLLEKNLSELIENAGSEAGYFNRSITKKSYFINRQIDLIAHATKTHPESIINWLEENSYVSKNDLENNFFAIISYFIGITFGRWKISTSYPIKQPELSDPFSPIPQYQPCSINGKNYSEKAKIQDIDILIQSIEKIVFIIWNTKDLGRSVLEEIRQNLDDQNIFTYLSNTKHFFEKHLRQYSKSRRQAPIYWPLQTLFGSYTLWVYYHGLTEQTLYTCVNDFVEPKLKIVTDDLN